MVVEGVLAVALIVSNHMDLIITVVVGHTAVCAVAVSNRRTSPKGWSGQSTIIFTMDMTTSYCRRGEREIL